MTPKRFYFVMCGLVGIMALGIIAAAVVGNSLLAKQSKKLLSLKLDNAVLDQQQTSLSKAKKDVQKYAQLEAEAKIIVPQDKDQAEAVREIVNIAAANNIGLSAITFPASTLGTHTLGTVAPPVTQVTPVSGIAGVFDMQISIQSDGSQPISYSDLINFLSKLEQNRRTAQVSSVNIQPNAQDPSKLIFQLTLDTYIKP